MHEEHGLILLDSELNEIADVIEPPRWHVAAIGIARAVLRTLYTLAVLGGCSYLVFWRGESAWLYLLAMLLACFRRGL